MQNKKRRNRSRSPESPSFGFSGLVRSHPSDHFGNLCWTQVRISAQVFVVAQQTNYQVSRQDTHAFAPPLRVFIMSLRHCESGGGVIQEVLGTAAVERPQSQRAIHHGRYHQGRYHQGTQFE